LAIGKIHIGSPIFSMQHHLS